MNKSCAACGHLNVPHALFCEMCGRDLATDAPSKQDDHLEIDAAGRLGDRLRIGAAKDNDLVLNYPEVAAQQAALVRDQGSWILHDIQGSTALNQPGTGVRNGKIEERDQVYFGAYQTSAARLLRCLGPLAGKDRPYMLGDGKHLIGRDPEAAICFEDPQVSRQHAILEIRGNRARVTDLGSANGTWLNGRRVERHATVADGDVLQIQGYGFHWRGGVLTLRLAGKGFCLEARNLSFSVGKNQEKKLLDEVSFSLYPGELCGLMGLAGAGKTTLMKCANGIFNPTRGALLINGINLHQHYDRFRTAIGYVPQEDIFHKDLTVIQALRYVARLRLGPDLERDALEERCDAVLDRLAMGETNADIRNTRIAHISGGQKRRMNIAIELLTDPSIFFLDEPISGLSSEEALLTMKILRGMADDGKTLLMSLHQPGMELYQMMDSVLYLHRGGRPVLMGPPLDTLLVTNPDIPLEEAVHPEQALRTLEKQASEESVAQWKQSDLYKEYVVGRRDKGGLLADQVQEQAPRSPGWWQFITLFRRNLDIKIGDRVNSLILLAQAPVIAVLIVLVFRNINWNAFADRPNVIYLMVIASIWFGCSNAARDICGEWAVFQRERMFNLKLTPFVAAKAALGIGVAAIQCAVMALIVPTLCDLAASPLLYFGVMWASASAGVCLGLLISAFASPFMKSNEIALGLIPIVLLPMVILGGVIRPYKDLDPGTRLLAVSTITHWGFSAGMQLEVSAVDGEMVSRPREDGGIWRYAMDEVLSKRFFNNWYDPQPWVAVLVILLMAMGFASVTVFYLKQKDLV